MTKKQEVVLDDRYQVPGELVKRISAGIKRKSLVIGEVCDGKQGCKMYVRVDSGKADQYWAASRVFTDSELCTGSMVTAINIFVSQINEQLARVA